VACALSIGGCGKDPSGPVVVSAIGGPPALANPNLVPLDAPSAFLIQTTAQGLVAFEASGQIEPALAQRWIVSDDGLRYTFRLARAQWAGDGRITAAEVVARLRAALGNSSKNPLRPVLGAVAEVEAMTDDVLEISLKGPRPHFLDLLAQPEMGLLREKRGSGPYQAVTSPNGLVRLHRPSSDEEEADDEDSPDLMLRGENAGLAVARFATREADLVTGGTLGDLPVARAARLPAAQLRFDPVAGLLGLVFVSREGPLADVEIRDALAMAIDRPALVAAFAVPNLQPRESLVPPGIQELAAPAAPEWSTQPMPARRAAAARTIRSLAKPLTLRVALPPGPGYRMLFAFIRADWRAIGVSAEAVAENASADVRLVDRVAPATLASWYLRNFTCSVGPVCNAEADEAMEMARNAVDPAERREMLAKADALLRDSVVFVSIAAPVRWSLASPRLTGFQPNVYGRHAPGELIARRR
jgi:peptide/nickel transport system substrate-binding protein